ncbi:hypothetical protein unique for Leptomonas pyrrhocoris [Leishmania donovani]|nr:hypothetical protein LDHU3_36.3440:CDS1 [Leishmania donovani]CAJ1993621.1 hypothetical protein unique for Leptomonas pyrrhocoris [Leishmania donovani]
MHQHQQRLLGHAHTHATATTAAGDAEGPTSKPVVLPLPCRPAAALDTLRTRTLAGVPERHRAHDRLLHWGAALARVSRVARVLSQSPSPTQSRQQVPGAGGNPQRATSATRHRRTHPLLACRPAGPSAAAVRLPSQRRVGRLHLRAGTRAGVRVIPRQKLSVRAAPCRQHLACFRVLCSACHDGRRTRRASTPYAACAHVSGRVCVRSRMRMSRAPARPAAGPVPRAQACCASLPTRWFLCDVGQHTRRGGEAHARPPPAA